MNRGTVKFFNEVKGFGFIKVEGTNDEIFVHATALKEKIRDGDIVEFDIVEGKRGLNAADVKRV